MAMVCRGRGEQRQRVGSGGGGGRAAAAEVDRSAGDSRLLETIRSAPGGPQGNGAPVERERKLWRGHLLASEPAATPRSYDAVDQRLQRRSESREGSEGWVVGQEARRGRGGAIGAAKCKGRQSLDPRRAPIKALLAPTAAAAANSVAPPSTVARCSRLQLAFLLPGHHHGIEPHEGV